MCIPTGFVQNPLDVHCPCCPGLLPFHLLVTRQQPPGHAQVSGREVLVGHVGGKSQESPIKSSFPPHPHEYIPELQLTGPHSCEWNMQRGRSNAWGLQCVTCYVGRRSPALSQTVARIPSAFGGDSERPKQIAQASQSRGCRCPALLRLGVSQLSAKFTSCCCVRGNSSYTCKAYPWTPLLDVWTGGMVIPPCCLEWHRPSLGMVCVQSGTASHHHPTSKCSWNQAHWSHWPGTPPALLFKRVSKMTKQAKPGKLKFLWLSFFFSRVLTLWFDYGHWPDVNEALVEGVKAIQIDTWLQVRALGYGWGHWVTGERTGLQVRTLG